MSDHDSIDNIIHALYDVISGPAGERDWDRERAMLHPSARLMKTSTDDNGDVSILVMDTEEFRERTTPILQENDFYEIEVSKKVDRFGNMAQVFSTYEAKRHPDDTELIKRGINSIQLYHDGSRWWIMSVFWDDERPDNPMPAEYLP